MPRFSKDTRKKTPEKEELKNCIQQCRIQHVSRESSTMVVKESVKKRCPNGTRRNKSGICVPKKVKSKSISISRLESADTPRKVYAKKYFNSPVKLLGKKKLFQVSFSNPEQFTNYTRITEFTGIECFIQTLFSLGLRERKMGKQDLEEIKAHNIGGIRFVNAVKYIEDSFGLNRGQIKHVWVKNTFNNNEEFKKHISGLRLNLTNNHATIITVGIKHTNSGLFGRIMGHYIVVYRYDNTLYFFDPQSNKITTDASQIFENRPLFVNHYGTFNSEKVLETTELKDSSCPMEYSGGY